MSARLVRLLVLAVLAVPVALLLSPAQAQFGRPPVRPGGLPRPPAPPGRFGGMPGGGLTQHEWVCSGCGKVLGRGAVKPIMPSCPFCGVKFSNGMDIEIDRPGFPRRGGRGNVPPTNPPEDPPPPADNEPPPADNPAAPAANNFVPPPAAAEPVSEGGTSSATRVVLIAAAVGGGFLFLFAAVGTCLYVFVARAAKQDVAQRRRKRVYHDEDD